MNWIHIQNDNNLYIRDLDTGRFTNIYVDASCFDGKYGIVDDTGMVRVVNESQDVREIVCEFFGKNKHDELETLMNQCGYEKIGYG